MKPNKLLLVFSAVALLLVSQGCIGVTGEFVEIRNNILSEMNDEYKSEVQFSIGSVGITVSSWIVDLAADEDFAVDIMDDISSIQVGVYEKIKGNSTPDISLLHSIDKDMKEKGWKAIVRNCKNEELSAVYVRNEPDEILNRLLVISSDHKELVLVEIEGDLKGVLSTVIREKGMEFKKI